MDIILPIQDVFGPRTLLFFSPNITLSYVAETKGLVPIGTRLFVEPDYSFDKNPQLDVLLIPGGPGTKVEYNNPALIDYVKRTYPKLKYIMSVCTGAQLLAKAGVLDGKNATTNKAEWSEITASGPNVNWVSHSKHGSEVLLANLHLIDCSSPMGTASFRTITTKLLIQPTQVVHDNIWTSSGVVGEFLYRTPFTQN